MDGLNHMSAWISSGDILGCLRGGVEEEEVSILEPQAGPGAKMYIKINQPIPKDGGFGQEALQRKVTVACHVRSFTFLGWMLKIGWNFELGSSKYIQIHQVAKSCFFLNTLTS